MAAFVGGVNIGTVGSVKASSFCGSRSVNALRNVNRATVAHPKVAKRNAVTMAATGETFEDWLMDNNVSNTLNKTLRAMFASCKEISYKIRTASCAKSACFNEFGDEQLAIDLLADKVIFENLRECGTCATASSEEVPEEVAINSNGSFSVAFDPLDGSSIIDTNFSVGTIFGVWPGSKLTGITGNTLAASGLAVYGPRTTISLAVDGIEGAHEFLLIDDYSGEGYPL